MTMDALGLALLVGGFAFLVSGLIFLVPTRRKQSAQREIVDENLEQVDHYLREMRGGRDDHP